MSIELMFVQTCRQCGIKQTASYEHESECFNMCTKNTKKMKSYNDIKERINELESRLHLNKFHLYEINLLKWIIGELD
jgi:hypothetical protein